MTARFPLSDLDGLTVWDQARLLEEGIEDVHALATANLVDLLLGTRVRIAAVLAGDEETGTATAEAILVSMAGNPNLEHVQAFRGHEWLAA
jgi:hypothetical protein